MNPQWNTPPDGDFAAYVERLSARPAGPGRDSQDGEHVLDAGMTPAAGAHAVVHDTATPGSPGAAWSADEARARLGSAVPHNLAKVMAIVWIALLAVLLSLKAPSGFVMALFVFGVWLAYRLRRWALPPGVRNWRQWLEEEAMKQKQKQAQRRTSK